MFSRCFPTRRRPALLAITVCFALLVQTIAAPVAAAAAQDRGASSGLELLLSGEPLVVTASKKAQRLGDAPAAVTVITEEDIRRSGASTIPDLLRSVPGVDVMEPNRSQSNVSIRGLNDLFANKLLVMIDGRSIYLDYFGGVLWNVTPLLLSRVKRIEVVRGPGSALYGANAFNGVINIITKTPDEMAAAAARGAASGTAVSAAGGQNSRFSEATLSLNPGPGGWAVTLGAGYKATDGFGERKPGAVADSARVPVLTADAQRTLGAGSLRVATGVANARADLTAVLNYRDADWDTRYLSLEYSQNETSVPWMARFYVNTFRLTQAGVRQVAARNTDLEVQQQRDLSSRHALVYGASFRHSQLQAVLTGPGRHEQDLWSLYLQDEYRAGPHTRVVVGGRLDHHSVHGTNITPRISLLRHLPGERTLRWSYGTAFRAPTLVDSYSDFPVFTAGVPVPTRILGSLQLRPEQVRSLEFAYRAGITGGGHVGLTVFHNKITNLIDYVTTEFAPSPPFPPFFPTEFRRTNAGGARAAGVELESERPLRNGLRGIVNYAYQDVAYENGSRVSFSPAHKANLGMTADLGRHLSAYAGLHYVGPSVYNDAQQQALPIPAYTRLDVRLGYRFGGPERPWNAALAVTNLLGGGHRELPENITGGDGIQGARHARTAWLTLSGGF
jgi:iron complex outermembrane receptor protein